MATAPSCSPLHSPVPIPIIETYSLIADGDGGSFSSSGSPQSTQPRYTAFVVRLTDASSRALNQTLAEAKQKRSKGGASQGYIELGSRGNSVEGTLCFGGSSSVAHRFSLTDAQRDIGPKGQLDVVEVQQSPAGCKPGTAKTGCMKLIGPLTHRMQISATTEDTFESTKQKAQQANEELRKNGTKVVKGPGGAGGATKMWQKINKTQSSTSHRPLTPLSHQHSQKSGTSKFTNGGNSSGSNGGDITKRPLRQRVMYKLLANPSTSSELLNTLSNEGISDYDRTIFDKTLKEVAQITRPTDSSSNAPAAAASPTYELKRSYYNEIRVDDWPFYNSWERQTCRKKVQVCKAQQHSGANGTNHGNISDDCTQRVNGKVSYRPPPKKAAIDHSPPSNNTKSSPPAVSSSSPGAHPMNGSSSRPGPGRGEQSRPNPGDSTQRVHGKSSYRPPPKKPLVASPPSAITANSPPSTAPVPVAFTSPPRSATHTTSPPAMQSCSPPPKKKPHLNGVESGESAPRADREPNPATNGHYDSNFQRKRRQEHRRPALTSANSNESHARTNGFHPVSSPSHSDTGNSDQWKSSRDGVVDYRHEYPEISSADDRRRYKDDFDREYPMYLKLYERLRLTASEFEKLGERLKRTAKESSEYKDIEREIFIKYHQFQQDADMRRSRREHERLRQKLGVIKQRVKEYDDRQLIASRMNVIKHC